MEGKFTVPMEEKTAREIEGVKELVKQYIKDALTNKRKAEKLLGGTRVAGEVHYLVKWETGTEASLLPSFFVKKHYPQQLIQFLEERLEWELPSDKE